MSLPFRTLCSRRVLFGTLPAVVLTLAGCTTGVGGQSSTRKADPWRLAGPFARLAHGSPNSGVDRKHADDPSSARRRRSEDQSDPELASPGDDRSWFLDFGVRAAFPHLGWAKQQLKRRLELPLRLDILGLFEAPLTPIDQRAGGALMTFRLGLGRQENQWLKWNVYAGGGFWEQRTRQRKLVTGLEVAFDYVVAYSGVAANIYPFATPRYDRYSNAWEHVKAGRPYVLTGFEVTYLDAEGRGKYSVGPWRIYSDHKNVRDWLFSGLLGGGWEIPLGRQWAVDLSGHYSFHIYRPEEFNGWTAGVGLRYRF